jgi:ribosome-binding factor A
MQEFGRYERVGAEMQRELARLLREDVRDPRLGMVTIQEVRVTRDLAHAKVYFTLMDSDQAKQVTKLLEKAASFLRRRLGEGMKLRSIPQLHFVYDTSIEEGARLSALIEQAVSKDEKNHED